jgi:integrase
MQRILAEEGLPLQTMHALRHSFASLLADGGVSPWVLKELLGHSDLATTQGYVHPVSRHRDAVELLDSRDQHGAFATVRRERIAKVAKRTGPTADSRDGRRP